MSRAIRLGRKREKKDHEVAPDVTDRWSGQRVARVRQRGKMRGCKKRAGYLPGARSMC